MTLRLIAGKQASSIDFPLFDSILDRTGKRQLQRLVTLTVAVRGEWVGKQGDVGHDLLVMSEGIVKLWNALPDGRRQIVAFRAAGELVTLHRCHTPWAVNAQAVTDCKLFQIPREPLRRLANRYPAIDRALLDLASDEITSLQDRLLALGRKSSLEKVASFILQFRQSAAAPSGYGREIQLPFRRPEIAEYLALTTESVSREFSRLKRQRIIAMPRPSHIVVLNQPALELMAQGISGLSQEKAMVGALDNLGAGD